jgi:hypothetical protein
LANVSASYTLRRGTKTHSISFSIRNLFDRDLLASHARLGVGREATLSYRIYF